MTSSRTASEILLALEAKIDQLTSMVSAQDLNLRILSNKLNLLMEQMKKAPPQAEPTFTASADGGKMPAVLLQNRVPPPNHHMISGVVNSLPMQENPQAQAIRRNSRQEAPMGRQQTPAISQKIKIQDPAPPDMSMFKQQLQSKAAPQSALPPSPTMEPVFPTPPQPAPELPQFTQFEESTPVQGESSGNKVVVTQRVLDKAGKSVFLADVEIFDEDNNVVFKNRTNGVGKWQASLPLGNYKVRISKRESVTKSKFEKIQQISVNGKTPQLNLEQLIVD